MIEHSRSTEGAQVGVASPLQGLPLMAGVGCLPEREACCGLLRSSRQPTGYGSLLDQLQAWPQPPSRWAALYPSLRLCDHLLHHPLRQSLTRPFPGRGWVSLWGAPAGGRWAGGPSSLALSP